MLNSNEEENLQVQKETFVASLGHDLKNPTLAQIRALELLLKGNFGNVQPEQKEILEMILDSCKYMNAMLASLLSTYRSEKGAIVLKYENMSLMELTAECVEEMVYMAKDKNVQISLQNNYTFSNICADKLQIKRVIMNLLSNSIKYAFKNSCIDIKIFKEQNYTGFQLQNNSPYIPEDKQKSIFAQYVSFAGIHKELGIGLGLYASKKIIEAHNGTIYVKSYPDNKNIFGFKIPIAKSPQASEYVTF